MLAEEERYSLRKKKIVEDRESMEMVCWWPLTRSQVQKGYDGDDNDDENYDD